MGFAISTPIANATIVNLAADRICMYRGFSIYETTGTDPALVYIREGTTTGTILDVIPIAAGQGVSDWYDDGILCDGDLVCVISDGAVEGSIRHS